MAQKTNPRRVARTEHDVLRARQAGAEFGMEFALSLVLLVLKDKHDAPDADIFQLRDEFMEYIDSINKGYLSYADVKHALYGDYDFQINLWGKGASV